MICQLAMIVIRMIKGKDEVSRSELGWRKEVVVEEMMMRWRVGREMEQREGGLKEGEEILEVASFCLPLLYSPFPW